MASLLHTLREMDNYLLPVLAQAWGLELDDPNDDGLPKALERVMTDPGRVRTVLEGLKDKERSALNFLINQNKGAQMPAHSFAMLYGDKRDLSKGQLARENPLSSPKNAAEALYFRGLIGYGFESGDQGAHKIVYIPEELLPFLREGSAYQQVEYDEEFDESAEDDDEEELTAPPPAAPAKGRAPAASAAPAAAPAPARARSAAPAAAPPVTRIEPLGDAVHGASVRAADSSCVDDLTTLLAYTRIRQEYEDASVLGEIEAPEFAAVLLTPGMPRLRLLLALGVQLNLLEYRDGRLEVKRADALSRWLSATRHEQVRQLAEAWRTTELYVDLLHVPGLSVDTAAGTTQYFPAGARKAALTTLAAEAPDDGWWAVEAFAAVTRAKNRDYLRPNGDYDRWYIADERGQYLRGLDSWPQVDGAVLTFYLTQPMHWLGLVDLATDSAGRTLARLNAYGRAFVKGGAFPKPPDPQEKLIVEADGRLAASRRVSRADRYQLARFTSWAGVSNGSYIYHLDANGLQIAKQQGISLEQIESFLRNVTDHKLPPEVSAFLETWKQGEHGAVTFERVTVLRVTAEALLETLWTDPKVRRYLGARLGPTAVIIRADQIDALRELLGARGVKVEMLG